jgi:hypothetical protein
MTSIRTRVRSEESSTDPTLNFSKQVQAAVSELSLLQIELGKARGLVDTNQLSTLLDSTLRGGKASDLIAQLLSGLAVLRGKLSGILSNSNY